MDRNVSWDVYVGDIKDKFSEMANNCFTYGVSEEKGVVLTGPPGSGKNFLVRTWLSSNLKVHDIATSPSALQDTSSPVHGAVANLEKVYDIAKMVAPTVIFFDEGDALAPKRSATGGQPSDALTNKFLNIIDGEIPLTKGVRKDEVGGSVIIGGHRKKTEKVLLYLRRMYMPLQNYKDLEPEFLIGYWQRKKDIIAVTHFADLMPEILFLDEGHNSLREELIEKRIQYKTEKYYAANQTSSLKNDIIKTKKLMRKRAEEEILNRVNAIRMYLLDSDQEKYISHEKIFNTYMEK